MLSDCQVADRPPEQDRSWNKYHRRKKVGWWRLTENQERRIDEVLDERFPEMGKDKPEEKSPKRLERTSQENVGRASTV